jgi:aldehyde dehydrogenase (NAD+)
MSARLFPNYIDGQWVDGPQFENLNPADTREVVGLHVNGTPADVERAAAAAQAALPGWSGLTGPARGAYLYKVADLLDQRFEAIAREMTLEEGKTLPESKGEVRRSINILRYFAAEGARFAGVLAPSERERVQMFAVRKPIGVVGLITPWNFPSAIPAWKLAPALLCGNTVVLKPASAAPLSAWRIVEACHDAGIPKGVVNFVAGPGGTLGRALLDAPQLKAISFTGSSQVGHKLHVCAFNSRWAARTRRSCWRTPTSTPPWKTSPTRHSSPRGRSAPPLRAPSSKIPSTTASSRPWLSARASSSAVTASSPASRSALASTRGR